MPIKVSWDDSEKTIIYARFSGDWTWEEYHAANQLISEMAAEIDHRFDTISDLRLSNGLPQGNLLDNIGQGHNQTAPNHGINVTIQLPRLLEAMRPLVTKITGRDNRYSATTIQEAYAIIQTSRELDADDTS